VPPLFRWWLAGVGGCAAVAIVGLTVGMGAWWIDLDAQDAARVVSSSSGALVLVLMLGYIGCVVAALVFAWTSWINHFLSGLLAAGIGMALVSFLVGWIPLRGGFVKLERLELSN